MANISAACPSREEGGKEVEEGIGARTGEGDIKSGEYTFEKGVWEGRGNGRGVGGAGGEGRGGIGREEGVNTLMDPIDCEIFLVLFLCSLGTLGILQFPPNIAPNAVHSFFIICFCSCLNHFV